MRHIINTQFLFTLIVCVGSFGSALGVSVGDSHSNAVKEESSDHVENISISPDTQESPCGHTQHKNSPQSIIYSCCKPYCEKHLSGFEDDEENDDGDHRDVLYFIVLQ